MFQASETEAGLQVQLADALRLLSGDGLRIHAVDANHFSILRQPAVRDLSGIFDAALRECLATEELVLMDLETERQTFERQGVIGPFKLWDSDSMTPWWKELRRKLLTGADARPPFANPVNYDRHLDMEQLSRLISEPALVQRFQNLLGPDVLCWRTEFFPKNPGDPGTGWHQVERYAIGEAQRGMLEPTLQSEEAPMELTAWIALTPARISSGCMRYIPGSHKAWKYNELGKLKWDGVRTENTFFGYNYDDLKLDPNWSPEDEDILDMEMEAGEFVIFTARCIHGSYPNTDTRQRMGFAVRVVPTHVRVYSDMTSFDEFGHHFDLARHGCVLIGGEDRYGHNRIAEANAWGRSFVAMPAS